MPASWVKDEAAWDRAKKEAEKQYPEKKGTDSFWAIVTHIYQNMSGQKSDIDMYDTGKSLKDYFAIECKKILKSNRR